MIRPLTKTRQDGGVYTRDPAIESIIARLSELPGEALIARCAIGDPANLDYVPSEAVLYFLRNTRGDNTDVGFGKLYQSLMRRLLRALPRAKRTRDGKVEVDLTLSEIRDAVRHKFNRMLAEDRDRGEEGLDYFEVRFDAAVASLRSTARRKAWKEAARQEVLETDDSGAPSLAVEQASGSLDLHLELNSDDPTYRSKVVAAIEALPELQRRIMHMLMKGIQIDSQSPDAVTICKVVGKAEKTVRNQRDKAIIAIRVALGLEASQ